MAATYPFLPEQRSGRISFRHSVYIAYKFRNPSIAREPRTFDLGRVSLFALVERSLVPAMIRSATPNCQPIELHDLGCQRERPSSILFPSSWKKAASGDR